MKKRSVIPYLKGALIVIVAYAVGFFLPQVFSDQLISNGQVSVIGPVTNQRNLNEVIKDMQEIIGEDAKFSIQQQTRGDSDLQFVVAIDGSIAALEGDELKQFGYLITVEDGSNPYKTNLLDASTQPKQFYAFFEEDLEGKINLVDLQPIHY